MRIKIIAVGQKMPAWVEQGYQEYAKRMPREMTVEMCELPMGHRNKAGDIPRAMTKEGEAMLAAIPKGDRVVALDVLGKPWSTQQLAKHVASWQMDGCNISLLIGGPDGLAKECLALAQQKWSLSALTLPHPLVRVVLIEQLYRAWTLLNNHPYHK